MNEQTSQEQLAKEAKKEYMQKYMKEYRKKNRVKLREEHKKWQKDNPEKVRGYQEKYWASKAREPIRKQG